MLLWILFGRLSLNFQTFTFYFVISFAILKELSEHGLYLSLSFFRLGLIAMKIEFDIAFL